LKPWVQVDDGGENGTAVRGYESGSSGSSGSDGSDKYIVTMTNSRKKYCCLYDDKYPSSNI